MANTHHIVAFYGNQTADDLAANEKYERLCSSYPQRYRVDRVETQNTTKCMPMCFIQRCLRDRNDHIS
ncbi:hypothetical protein J8M01_07555 [Pseudoalteromonas sp. MMG005]|nr:hypothetical protein [Pseudoalteromonas sp. MMG005]